MTSATSDTFNMQQQMMKNLYIKYGIELSKTKKNHTWPTLLSVSLTVSSVKISLKEIKLMIAELIFQNRMRKVLWSNAEK